MSTLYRKILYLSSVKNSTSKFYNLFNAWTSQTKSS